MLDLFKFMGCFCLAIVMIIAAIIAAPAMWEQATSDRQHPHSGATPEHSSWDISLEEGMEKAELIRQSRAK